MQWSRGLEAFAKMVRAVLPRLDYQACYFARVAKFDSGRQQVDLEPDDPRLPTMQGVPLRGAAGMAWSIDPSSRPTVLVTWENGDPARPIAFGFGLGVGAAGAHVRQVIWTADQIILGGSDGAQPATLGDVLNTILQAIKKHTHPPNSGGAIAESLELEAVTNWDPRATNVRVK